MPATAHTDPHTLPHCGEHKLNFDTDLELLEHLEQVEHEVHAFFKCAGCKKENCEVKERIKQIPGDEPARFCEDCLKSQAEKYAKMLEEKAKSK